MKSNRIMWILVSIVVFATISVSVTTLRSQEVSCEIQDKSAQEKQTPADFESQFPIADYNAPEEANPERRVKRKVKSKRYDNYKLVIRSPGDDTAGRVLVTEDPLLPAIPAKDSDVIVTGKVLDAQAYLSDNRSGVYSEFTIQVDEILKNNSSIEILRGNQITADRAGGFVRYPNGRRILYSIAGERMPRVGRQYVLFLTKTDNSPNYYILTGYELKENDISPLDARVQYDEYKQADITSFLKAIRNVVAQPSQTELRKKEN